ncbi:MAG: hypothetical protein NW206_02460 [Hyphomonadaceae bacterium]|nr:hypothetical protein [Hyphomonadaceae bacterium]
MRKLLLIAAAASFWVLANTGQAEARIFEPQADWLHAGRLCASTRGDFSRRGEALPPRTCRTPERARERRAQINLALREDSICTRKRVAESAGALV